jgi:hypothetical protein
VINNAPNELHNEERCGAIHPACNHDINRLFTLPPGVPAEWVAVMRKAFDVTFTDSEFQADIEKARAVLLRISI